MSAAVRRSHPKALVTGALVLGLIHYLGATTLPAPLHLAAGLDDYRQIQAIREP